MADELNETAAPIAPVETADADAPASSSAAQQKRVADLIAAQRAPIVAAPIVTTASAAPAAAKRGPGRPKKDAAPAAPGEKRKKPSGKKPTRAELAARVKELQAQRGAAAPAADGTPAPTAAPAEPSGLNRPEVRARFAAGVSRVTVSGAKFLAARRGPHWNVAKLEADALGEATADAVLCIEELAPTLAPYIGKAVALAPLGIFAAVLFGIVSERMEKDADVEARRARGEPISGDRIAVVESHALTVAR